MQQRALTAKQQSYKEFNGLVHNGSFRTPHKLLSEAVLGTHVSKTTEQVTLVNVSKEQNIQGILSDGFP